MSPFISYDDGKGLLAPLTDLRAAFDVRTGAMTTLERVQSVVRGFAIGLFVPRHLVDVTRERHAAPVNERPKHNALIVSARCPIPPERAGSLGLGEAIVEEGSGDLVAAHLSPDAAVELLQGRVPAVSIVQRLPAPALLSRPWHVRAFRDACINHDLALMSADPAESHGGREAPRGVTQIGESGLRIAPSAKVYPGCTIDVEHGPVVIDEHAVIRPGAVLVGPCYVGTHSTVLERATIRPYTSIGPWCKVNGEVGGTIFQGFANKAHDGYVGDTFVGEWVNLGAGTTTSNLLNTYGEIIARPAPAAANERTGLQFLGATLGDHVKTAICTRLMTGSIVHTGVMIASTAAASGCVPPFSWITDAGSRTFRLDKFLEVMQAAMGRRSVRPSDAYTQLIRALHAHAARPA